MTNELGNDELDDLIAEVMQAEIPPPSDDYWTQIDRSLTEPAGMHASPRSPTGWTSTRLLASAAAIIVVIALAGAAVFASLSDSSTDLDASGEPQTGTPTSSEPAPSEPAPSEPADIVVSSFEPGAVTDAGLEAIGCWFYRGGNQSDLVFHGGFEATVMVVGGHQIIGHTSGFWSVEDTVTAGDYEIRFTDVGAPVADSIESQRQPATLVVTPTDATRAPITIPGELWCGV